jgi:hypothetical protein
MQIRSSHETRTTGQKSLSSFKCRITFENKKISPAKLAGQLRYAVLGLELLTAGQFDQFKHSIGSAERESAVNHDHLTIDKSRGI